MLYLLPLTQHAAHLPPVGARRSHSTPAHVRYTKTDTLHCVHTLPPAFDGDSTDSVCPTCLPLPTAGLGLTFLTHAHPETILLVASWQN